MRSIVRLGWLAASLVAALVPPTAHAQRPAADAVRPAVEMSRVSRGAAFPPWFRPFELPPETSRTDPVVMRLAETYFRVGKESTVVVHRAVQANDAGMMAEIGQYPIAFQPEYQRVELHRVRILRDGVALDKMSSADVRVFRREADVDHGVFRGQMSATIVVDDLRKGDTFEIAYSLIGQNPIFEGRYVEAASWDAGYPITLRRVTLDAPAQRVIRHRVVGEGEARDVVARESLAGDRRITRFEARDLPALDFEPYVPVDVQVARWIQFSEFATWAEVAQWAVRVFAVDSTAFEALPGGRDPKSPESIARALGFVQNQIRYVSLSVAENSHRPAPAREVLARRYGDCKDKSALLVAHLRRQGIEAQPVLVSVQNRRGLEKFLPSPGVFDHAIVRAVVDGKAYYLDPTVRGQPERLESLAQRHQDSQVLVVSAATRQLSAIPREDREALVVNARSERVEVERADGPARMDVRMEYSGAHAEAGRVAMARMTPQQRRKAFEGDLDKRYPKSELLGDPEITDDIVANRLTIALRFRVPDFIESSGDRWTIRYAVPNAGDFFHVPNSGKRRFALAMPQYPSQARYDLEVMLPEPFDGKLAPEARSVKAHGFDIAERFSYSGRVVKTEVTLNARADRIEARDVPAFMADLHKAQEILRGTLHVSRPKSPARPVAAISYKQAVRERLEKVIAITGESISRDRLAGQAATEALCERALAQAYLGRIPQALSDADAGVDSQPSSADALRCRGEVYLVAGEFDKSVRDLSRVVALGSRDAGVYFQRGVARYFAANLRQAATDFTQARELATDPAWKTRADIWNAIVARREAAGAVAGAQAGASANTDAWPESARRLMSEAGTPDAVLSAAHQDSGPALDATLAEAYFYVAEHHLLRGERTKASVFLARAIDKGAVHTWVHLSARHELARLESPPR